MRDPDLFTEVPDECLGALSDWLNEITELACRTRGRELLAGRADSSLRELQFELMELEWEIHYEIRIRREVRRWILLASCKKDA